MQINHLCKRFKIGCLKSEAALWKFGTWRQKEESGSYSGTLVSLERWSQKLLILSRRLVLGNIFAWIRVSFFPLSFPLFPCLLEAQDMSHRLVQEQRRRRCFLSQLRFGYWGSVFIPGSAVPTSFKSSPKDDLPEAKMKNTQVSFFPNVVRISQCFEKWNIQFLPSVFCRSQLCLIFVNHHISQWQLSDRERSLAVDLGVKALTGSLCLFLVHLTLWRSLSEVPVPLFQEVGFTSAGLRARWLCHETTQMWGPVFPPEDPLSLKPQRLLGLKVSWCSYSGPKTARNLKKQNCDIRYLSKCRWDNYERDFFLLNGLDQEVALFVRKLISRLLKKSFLSWGKPEDAFLEDRTLPHDEGDVRVSLQHIPCSTVMQQSVRLAVESDLGSKAGHPRAPQSPTRHPFSGFLPCFPAQTHAWGQLPVCDPRCPRVLLSSLSRAAVSSQALIHSFGTSSSLSSHFVVFGELCSRQILCELLGTESVLALSADHPPRKARGGSVCGDSLPSWLMMGGLSVKL